MIASSPTSNGELPRDEIPNGTDTDRYGFKYGDQYTDPASERRLPMEVYRNRELKWMEMTKNSVVWDKWMQKRFKKVKDRCRKGLPESMRARGWQYLCGAHYIFENKEDYAQIFEKLSSSRLDPKIEDEIQRDLDRQFPFHELFAAKGGQGQDDLFRVLKAWAVMRPRVGYCQAQAPVAAVLLMHMPAQQAFWCFAQVCEKFMESYYSPGLEKVRLDGEILFALLKKVSSPAYKHLKRQEIEPVLYMTEWFMCLFCRTLPWPSVLRILDMFFCEGIKVIFRVALVLLRSVLDARTMKSCPSMYETIERLRKIDARFMGADYLVSEMERLNVTQSDMEAEHRRQFKKMHKQSRQQPATGARTRGAAANGGTNR